MKPLIVFCTLIVSTNLHAVGYSQDSGKISKVLLAPDGSIAFMLTKGAQGLPNTNKKFACTTTNGWVGHANADLALKSAILLAKTTNTRITVTIDGCEGRWFKIRNLTLDS